MESIAQVVDQALVQKLSSIASHTWPYAVHIADERSTLPLNPFEYRPLPGRHL